MVIGSALRLKKEQVVSLLRSVLITVMICGLCGCHSTRPTAAGGGDYRRTQANRQTQRDSESAKKKTRRPLDDPSQDRQGIIDQPR